MSYIGRRRGGRRVLGRVRRRSTTIKLQDKATVRGLQYSVYSRRGGPEDRIVFVKDPDFTSQRTPIGTKIPVRYLGRTYPARKSIRLVKRRDGSVNSVPVAEFEVS